MIQNIINDYGLCIIIVEAVAIIALLLWHFLFSDNHSEEIDKLEYDKKMLKRRLATYDKALNKARADLKRMEDWYVQNKHLLVRQEQPSQVIEFDRSQENMRQGNADQVQYQYLQEAYDGKFLKLFPSLEKCFFRTWAEGGTRYFEFCGNIAKALANINAIFDDVCEIEGKRNGATNIENVSAGILDSELRIISKAKIKLK